MFSNRKARWLFTCALLFATPMVFAVGESTQQRTQRESQYSSQMQQQRMTNVDLTRATSVIGHDVMDTQGKKVGTIKDIVLNKSGDRIIYAALAYGGVAGIGDRFLAIPWNQYTVTPTGTYEPGTTTGMWGDKNRDFRLTVNASKDVLEKSASFRERGNWPTQASTSFSQGTNQPAAAQSTEVWRLSKLLGQNVFSDKPLQMVKATREPRLMKERTETMANRPEIGELKDVALGIHTGTPIYGEVNLTNIENHKDFRSIVPWSALSFRTENNRTQVALNVPDTNTLLAYGYQSDKTMPALGEQQYAEKIYTAYHQRPDWEMLGFVSPTAKTTEQRTHMGETKTNEPMHQQPNMEKPKSEQPKY